MIRRNVIVAAVVAVAAVLGAVGVPSERVSAARAVAMEQGEDGCTPAYVKTLVARMGDELEKDSGRFPDLIRGMEDCARQCGDSATAALLRSLTAEMYARYYKNNRGTIDRLTDLQGYVPEDIREWSGNLFEDKVREMLRASLSPADVLQATPSSAFAELLEGGGSDAAVLRPSLFDFLAYRAISIQPEAEWYESLVAFHRADGNVSALLMAELQYAEFLRECSSNSFSEERYGAKLDSMADAYRTDPYAVEIAKQQWLLKEQEQYLQPSDALRDSVRGELYRLAGEMLSEYRSSPQAAFFENRIAQLEQPRVSLEHNRNVYPGKALRLRIGYRNVPQLTVRIYRNSALPEVALRTGEQKKKGKVVKTLSYKLNLPDTYCMHDTVVEIPMAEPGLYLCEVNDALKRIDETVSFSVSSLSASARRLADGTTEVLVADYWTGKPLQGAFVVGYNMSGQRQPRSLDTVRTGINGLAQFSPQYRKSLECVRAFIPADTASFVSNVPGYYTRKEAPVQMSVSLFTDRSLYRPGQTLSFKGIAFIADEEKPCTVSREEINIRLRDSRGQELAMQTFRTNDFGSFNGEFTLPDVTQNGVFHLVAERGQASFRVEEYKRPSFALEVEPVRKEVFFNEELELKGFARTYSGVDLREGKLAWTITRRPLWGGGVLRLPGYSFRSEQVSNGTATLRSDGTFSIPFTASVDSSIANNTDFISYNYILNVAMTDSRGETQECDYAFTVGNRGLRLSVSAENRMDKEKAAVSVSVHTLNKEEVARKGTFSLYRLGDDGTATALADSGIIATKDTLRNIFSSLESGKYRLAFYVNDTHGNACSSSRDIIFYGTDDKCPPINTHTWILHEKMECNPGETAGFVFGTADTMAYVLYEIYNDSGKRVELQRFTFNNENRRFVLPFREEYGRWANVQLSFVKEGSLYQEVFTITRRRPDRKLTFHTLSFRDKLIPGTQEQWKFRITASDSLPVRAEVLAGMYDFSLDRLYPFKWNFYTGARNYFPSYSFRSGECFSLNSCSGSSKITLKSVPEYKFDRIFDAWTALFPVETYTRMYATSSRAFSSDNTLLKTESAPQAGDLAVADYAAGAPESEEGEPDGGSIPEIRENFAETAFFYPVLVTDSDGTFSFSFTVPESNTTWKLQLLAITDSLKSGYLMQKAVTSKPLMVRPDWPRFLRESDEVSIAAQIINQSGEFVEGNARLELFDPETNLPVAGITGQQQPFALPGDSSATLRWSFTVPETKDGVTACRIIADATSAGDGEQVLIPVLPSAEVVTESVPFFLSGEGTKTIGLPLSGKGSTMSAVVEISANPVWYAIQALPTLASASEDDALSWFCVYYTNVLADFIVRTHPELKPVIQKWLAAGSESGLVSNLEKNPDLKAVVLEETPWVLDAVSETGQMHRLGLLFQPNRAEGMRRSALSRLAGLQLPSGGWGWFKGMRENRHITLQILKGMAQLSGLGAVEYSEEEKKMQVEAIAYLDRRIKSDYESLLRTPPVIEKHIPSSEQVEYLYVRSFFRDILEGEAAEAVRYFTRRATETWKELPLYSRAALARVLWKNGDKERATEIAKWFAGTASSDAEMGVYWKNNRSRTSGQYSTVETHCLAMAMMGETMPGKLPEAGLKQWLLNQKRTQAWESAPASLNAIFTLLEGETDWLGSGSNRCVVSFGGNNYPADDGMAALGYRRIVISPAEGEKLPATVSVTKEGEAPAWGAVYVQSIFPLREMPKAGGSLSVEKKIFLETPAGGGKQLRELEAGETLRVGDRVTIRLTLRSDRDMSFVVLKDLHAGCLESVGQLSGMSASGGLFFYRNPKDTSENFYFDSLPEGTYVLEYSAYVARQGGYAGGTATLQCLYAPEFVSRSESTVLEVAPAQF